MCESNMNPTNPIDGAGIIEQQSWWGRIRDASHGLIDHNGQALGKYPDLRDGEDVFVFVSAERYHPASPKEVSPKEGGDKMVS